MLDKRNILQLTTTAHLLEYIMDNEDKKGQ